MVKVEISCPLGHVCERTIDDKIDRCAWFTRVAGKDPQTGKDIDKWGCAIAWLPVLSAEMSRTNRGQTAALESFRNEMMEDNDAFKKAILEAQNARALQGR